MNFKNTALTAAQLANAVAAGALTGPALYVAFVSTKVKVIAETANDLAWIAVLKINTTMQNNDRKLEAMKDKTFATSKGPWA
jgi:hypothetical protein